MFETTINDITIKLETDLSVFSPSAIDSGTLAMLSFLDLKEEDKVLDLGCGQGPVGIYCAKILGENRVVMCDVSSEAVNISKSNAVLNNLDNLCIIESNGFANIEDKDFTVILSNPPYHTDFSVAKEFIENGFKHLVVGGTMFMVTKRLEWYKNKLTSIFGGVKVREKDGYYVFIAEKRAPSISKKKKEQKNTLSKKLQRKQKPKK
ncbi:MAG: class I SAM-dependent methyltransferase [Ruminococcaceae bacterium]|nr:class I SAM-dependent methyltransferase [Oscillospiraceae bacterium]